MRREVFITAEYGILNRIDSPADLRSLSDAELDTLAAEIRAYLVENVSRTGGHLASNLGVVELTLALHRALDTPHDRIIFDVGHQSYVHKLVTGRRDRFPTLRQGGGLSGFTKRDESEYDCFGAGHSSTSLSAALGFAEADRLSGSDAYTVAVIGDGAFTGGMIHEALNNCDNDLRLIIVINENEMSISRNIGRFANNLTRIRAGSRYLRTKKATRNFVKRIPLIGDWLFCRIRDAKKALKNLMYGSNYFEDLGLYYLGPVDGHDRAAMERLIAEAKSTGRSAVIHIKTTKGKGFEPAECDPGHYHGVSPENKSAPESDFSQTMGKYLCEKAKDDRRICAITAAMADGTGLSGFAAEIPERFFDVGIAEEHALTFAAGLAAAGMKPVAAIYSTFLQRGYDNIIHDIALQNLPVTLCVDRAGINAADGATHHGIFDVAFLSEIPGMNIYTPLTFGSLRACLDDALDSGKPCAVRYPHAGEYGGVISRFYPDGDFSLRLARADFTAEGSPEAVIITDGRIVTEALKAEALLTKAGITCGTLLLEKPKPYSDTAKAVYALLDGKTRYLLFYEEEIRSGGMGMLLSDEMRRRGMLGGKEYAILALDDNFAVRNADIPVYEAAGLDARCAAELIINMKKNSDKTNLKRRNPQ
mgnify:FL=1